MLRFKNQNLCQSIKIVAIAVNEYEEKTALISKQFNEGIDLLYKDIVSKMCSLRIQRDEKLTAAWRNYITTIKPYLIENGLSIPAEPDVVPRGHPAPVD